MSNNNVLTAWKIYFAERKYIYEAVFSLFVLAIILILYAGFLTYIERREGFSFSDPILRLFDPIDLTWIIFALIYSVLIAGVIYLIKDPERFLFAAQIYSLIIIVRMITMFLLPLNPPHDMILLADPFIELFGTGKTLTNDLFFSGHTATLFMLYLVCNGKIKTLFLIASILVAALIILQHIHYSIDVFASFIFVYAVFKFYSARRKSQ